MFSPTGLSPTTADHPRPLRLTHSFLTAAQTGRSKKTGPTTPHTQPLPGITCTRFSHPPLSLATTHGITICFLFLRVLRCFTSPRSPPPPMYSVTGDTTSLVPGFPIRTSSDQRSVDSSPRLIAASYVLHRLPVPRHPPCALKHLQHKITKNEIRKNCTSKQTKTRPQPHRPRKAGTIMRAHSAARCSQPLSTNQTPHPTTKVERQHANPPARGPAITPGFLNQDEGVTGLLSQSPIVCLAAPAPNREPTTFVVHQNRHPLQARPISRIACAPEPPHDVGGA
jgi:hypothetical protein